MWAYGHQCLTKDVDDGHMTQEYGVEVEFDQSSCTRHHDQNLIWGKLGYVGKIQEIIRVDFSSFQCIIFRCKWWDTFDQNNLKEYRDSGMICINSRKIWDEAKVPLFSQNTVSKFFLPRCVG
jgi:hypothetical protein